MYGNKVTWLDRFCAKHPRFGIPNLMLYIAAGNVAIYLIDLFSLGRLPLVEVLFFSRYAILRGQVWRLVSFVFISESGDVLGIRGTGVFFVLISAYFYYWIGSLLEREWGTTKFTVFYLGA